MPSLLYHINKNNKRPQRNFKKQVLLSFEIALFLHGNQFFGENVFLASKY